MPASGDPSLFSATELSAEIAARRLSPVAVVEAFLARIAAQNQRLHAYIDRSTPMTRDEAAEGRRARAIRSGHAVGPLHGVPITLKDVLIDLEGRVIDRRVGGVAAERRSPRDRDMARKNLIAAGMIVLGKTHTVEFAMGGWGTNHHMGTPWNPWDPTVPRTPGGSSSGSGVAVASAMAPWAIGTDTGGSVRLPASWCGITGLKTTIGRNSAATASCRSPPSLDIARTDGALGRGRGALGSAIMQGPDLLDRLDL